MPSPGSPPSLRLATRGMPDRPDGRSRRSPGGRCRRKAGGMWATSRRVPRTFPSRGPPLGPMRVRIHTTRQRRRSRRSSRPGRRRVDRWWRRGSRRSRVALLLVRLRAGPAPHLGRVPRPTPRSRTPSRRRPHSRMPPRQSPRSRPCRHAAGCQRRPHPRVRPILVSPILVSRTSTLRPCRVSRSEAPQRAERCRGERCPTRRLRPHTRPQDRSPIPAP